MKVWSGAQGSDEWKALRAKHFTASEASAMSGASKSVTRSELLKAKATGIDREFSAWVQKNLLDKGHEVEAEARTIAEDLIGQELFPATGISDEYPQLLASFDGITMLEDVCWECKSWNAEKAEWVRTGQVPPCDRWQVVQQLVVSRAEKCLYMVTDGTAENTEYTWMSLDPKDEQMLIAGWKQFEEDLATFEVQAPAEPAAIGRAPENLPALHIEVTGMVTASNLAAFKDHALAVFAGINRDLQTDQDFANAESTVKWCSSVEDKLKAAKQHALSQTASIDELFNAIDAISESARATRLELDKLVKARKEARRLEIKQGAEQALAVHIETINKRLDKVRLPAIPADFAGAIKGKRTIESLQDAVDSELARAKIEANAIAEKIDANLASLRELAAEHAFLFADAQQLVLKSNDDLVSLIKVRIAEHQQAEQRRLGAEREKIRAEEQARLESEQRAEQERLAAEEHQRQQAETAREQVISPPPAAESRAANELPRIAPAQLETQAADDGARIKLGDINARLGFSLSADFLRSIGFEPAGRERAALLYRAADFPSICSALIAHIDRAARNQIAA